MIRNNEQKLGEVIKSFFEENPQLQKKIREIRLTRAWGAVLGPMVSHYTTGLYVKEGVLFVKLSSSVLRSELLMCKDMLITNLNKYVGADILHDIVIR